MIYENAHIIGFLNKDEVILEVGIKMKGVFDQKSWIVVSKELEKESLKLASYDNVLIPLLGNLKGKKILDYGAGPGVLALAMKKLGAKVKVYDISPDMLRKAGAKIGNENVYEDIKDVPEDYFDFVICNLVLCIVNDKEVENIAKNIKKALKNEGVVYIGFCNPKICDVKESQLDFRFNNEKYEKNHVYKKIKKEGRYEILEWHRPIDWYKKVYKKAGLKLIKEIFTPEYTLNKVKINDFIIFELKDEK
ncbi:class I SAM-dependent methyltransferase [Candidatus Pacearchaeota archaeon]|nr:class I SAM-dependent methyltransferase [Candidatus Pacearchaeota archaeon]